jgi:hypothetical protein
LTDNFKHIILFPFLNYVEDSLFVVGYETDA